MQREESGVEKKRTLREFLCRMVQSVILAAEITAIADFVFAVGTGLPRTAFWGVFAAGTAALLLWRGFSRKARRTAALLLAAVPVGTVLALFCVWKCALPSAVYEAPETKPAFAGERILIVAPHEDDEFNLTAGMLETLAGENEVYVLFLSTGDAAGQGERRVDEAVRALSLAGVPEERVIFLGYGDGVPEGGTHVYNAAPDAVTPSLSGAVQTHAAAQHPAYREGTAYTRENLLADLRGAMEAVRADVIFCTDYDENIDHRALSLFFDEAIGAILTAEPEYRPLVFKGFAYSTAFHAPADFYANVNVLSTVHTGAERMENGVFLWEERVRFPVKADGLSRSLYACGSFTAAECYESQKLWRITPRIVNGDRVFWQRCTGSLLYGAEVRVSSGAGEELNDFRLLHSEDLAAGAPPYGAVWIPESGDALREAEFSFAAADITEIRLYDNPSPEDNILAAEIVFPNGHRYETGAIDPAGTSIIVSEPDCGSFTVRVLKTEGERAGLTEVEAYAGTHDTLPPFLKLTDGEGNFVYDYRLSAGEERAELSVYAPDGRTADTVSCEGADCTAEIAEGRLCVFCPKGRSCTVTVTDGSGMCSDSIYVAHETAAIRFVNALEAYCAHGIPKTNLYTFAADFYVHVILGW